MPGETEPPPSLTAPADRDAYQRAARWASIRQRQAAHDRAVVVDAYFRGFLEGMREEADGVDAPPMERTEADAEGGQSPSAAELEIRARLEGYADGRRWRERGKLGGIVRLGRYQSGKSTRRFAAQDVVHPAEKVSAWMKYKSNVPEAVSDELLRRLHLVRAPGAPGE